jgi:hypothetical protein
MRILLPVIVVLVGVYDVISLSSSVRVKVILRFARMLGWISFLF